MSYFPSLCKYLTVAITAPVVVPVALAFTSKHSPHLASFFSLWDTPDQALPGDLKQEVVSDLYEKRGWFLTSWYWLGWRNKAYGAARKYGVMFTEECSISTNGVYPSDKTEIRGTGKHTYTNSNGVRYWERYGVYGKKFGLRIRFGWKLQPLMSEIPREGWNSYISRTATGSLAFHISLRKLGI